jgi:hypothetical protein
MICGKASQWVHELLQKGTVLTVELVTSKGIYADLCGHKILLCSNEFGMIPNGISLESMPQLAQGQQIPCKDVRVTVADYDTSVWNGDVAGLTQCLSEDPGTGFGLLLTKQPLPPQCEIAKPLLQKLLEAVLEDDRMVMENSVLGLLGLGKGLTPSGDDVLAGLAYGLRHSPVRYRPAVVHFTQVIRENAHRLTNAVSADYLCAVAGDQPFERLAEAWRDPGTYGKKLMEIGSNSGREMLLGLLIAACIVKSLER